MIRVYVSSVIDASADSVWARIRDFNALPLVAPGHRRQPHREQRAQRPCRLHPPLPHARRRHDPRAAAGLSDYDFSCVYEILESPMGVSTTWPR
jgi:hypothetical protein